MTELGYNLLQNELLACYLD